MDRIINFKIDPKEFAILKENVRIINTINLFNLLLVKQSAYIE